MHLLIIISVAVIVAGLIVGLSLKFTGGNYFNYSGEWGGYESIVVSYSITDEDKIEETCETAFKDAGVKYYHKSKADTTSGGQLVYKFYSSTDGAKLDGVKDSINTKLEIGLSTATHNSVKGTVGDGKSLTYASIALATVVVFQFIYFAVRYKLASAFAALLANVHNVFIYLALLTLLRVPVSASCFAFAAITVLLTVIATCFMFDKARKNAKSESYKKLSALEQADYIANDSFKLIWTSAVALAAATLIVSVFLLIIGGVSVFTVTPVLVALVSIVSVFYGTAFFTPAVYSRFKKIGDGLKSKPANASKSKKSA